MAWYAASPIESDESAWMRDSRFRAFGEVAFEGGSGQMLHLVIASDPVHSRRRAPSPADDPCPARLAQGVGMSPSPCPTRHDQTTGAHASSQLSGGTNAMV